MKNGDYFNWRWADNDKHAQAHTSDAYLCKTRRAVFKDGHLYDTFGNGASGDGSVLNVEDVILDPLGNVEEMEKVRFKDITYFDEADLIETSTPTASWAPTFLRVGAKRSRQAMINRAHHKINYFDRLVTIFQLKKTQMEAKLKEIESSENLEDICL